MNEGRRPSPLSLTLDDLGHLDDEALVDVAQALGLTWPSVEPAYRIPCMGTTEGWCTWDPASGMYHAWNPAVSVPQATALLQSLRTRRDWYQRQTWGGSYPEGRQGYIAIWTPEAEYGRHYGSVPQDEARAVLLVCVCAVQAEHRARAIDR